MCVCIYILEVNQTLNLDKKTGRWVVGGQFETRRGGMGVAQFETRRGGMGVARLGGRSGWC